VEIGTEERGAMFTEENDGGGDEEDGESEVEARVSGMGHGVKGFYMRSAREKKLGSWGGR